VKHSRTIVCVGGGIVGVYAALRARQLQPDARILLVEQDNALGGLLRSDIHPNGLAFDRGTHILSQTGVPAIDALLFDDLDATRWHRFGGAKRDLCGLLTETEVLDGSPFLPAPVALVDERLKVTKAEQPNLEGNLFAALSAQHGPEIVEAVFRAPIRNLYRCELEELDRFVAGQLPLWRVVAGDIKGWLARAHDSVFRSLVACPDQRQLPDAYANPLLAMYPRRMGIGQLFDKFAAQLAAARVEICLSTKIVGLTLAAQRISAISLAGPDDRYLVVEGDLEMVWAVPPFQLPGLLGRSVPAMQFKPGWRGVIADFCARTTRQLGCYYYLDYGRNDGFRLTNYSALCDEAAALDASPFTFELWWRGDEDLDATSAKVLLAQRFQQLGLVTDGAAICDVRLRRTTQGILLATTQNMSALAKQVDAIAEVTPENLLNIGLLSEPRLFFTGDMLRNAERRLSVSFA
jgi:hypothetical protein